MSAVLQRSARQLGTRSVRAYTRGFYPDIILRPAQDRLRALHSRNENWDGRGSAKPEPQAIGDASAWLASAYNLAVDLGLDWINPAISSSETGEVVLEWAHDGRRLSIYVSDRGAYYIQAWGPHIEDDMFDDDLTVERLADLLLWLL